jgi:hypothetical protein
LGKHSPIPTVLIDEAEVNESFEAFASMRRLAQAEPHLLDNKYFRALQDTAYARFLLNFEAL